MAMAETELPASEAAEAPPKGAPLGGTRSEAMRRLQIGGGGLFAMVLVMGVASAISNRAQVVENKAVPDAAPTTEPTEAPTQVDPLADAGVVPVVPAEDDEAQQDEMPERTTVPDIEPRSNPSDAVRNNAPSRN